MMGKKAKRNIIKEREHKIEETKRRERKKEANIRKFKKKKLK